MNWTAVTWGSIALVLIAAETFAPGAFMLWMGLAAAVVFVMVLVAPGMTLLAQVLLFVALSVVAVLVYKKFFPKRERPSDRPLLNRRAEQMVGRVAPLDQSIVSGRGRLKIDDAFWVVEGPDLAAGTPVRVVAVDGMTLRVQEATA